MMATPARIRISRSQNQIWRTRAALVVFLSILITLSIAVGPLSMTASAVEPTEIADPIVSSEEVDPASEVSTPEAEVASTGSRTSSLGKLDPTGKVLIEKKQGSSSPFSLNLVKGNVTAGTTIWANAYEYDDEYWDHFYLSGPFTYQWYSSAEAVTDTASAQPIAGAIQQSLTVDAELAKQLDGRYILVAVSDGSITQTSPGKVSELPVIRGSLPISSVRFDNGGVVQLMVGTTLQTSTFPAVAEPTFAWETAPEKTGPFTALPEMGSSLVLTDEMVGLYLRVTTTTGAVSKQAVTSTPVASAESWLVDVVNVTASTDAYAGTELTASSRGRNSQNTSRTDIPDDQIAYTWQSADSKSYNAIWTDIPGATGVGLNTFTVTPDLAGKYVRATADAGIPTWIGKSSAFGPIISIPRLDAITILSEGEKLPHVIAGTSVSAQVTDDAGEVITDHLTFEWSRSQDEDGPFTVMATGSDSTLALQQSDAGAYIRLTVTGMGTDNTIQHTFAVHPDSSLEAALNVLSDFVPIPNSDRDTNVVEMVRQKLADADLGDIEVSLESTSDPSVIAADGTVVGWFYTDPSSVTEETVTTNSSDVTFTVKRGGETATYVPGEKGAITVGWDRARVRDVIVEDLHGGVDLVDYLNRGDTSLDAVTWFTKTLPVEAGWTNLAWSSSDTILARVTDDPYVLIDQRERKKLTEDVPVTITAAFTSGFADADGSTITADKTFDITVKKSVDVSKLTSAELSDLLATHYTEATLKDFVTKKAIDPAAVTGDIQLPIPRDLFVEAHELNIQVMSSDEGVIKVNGYRGQVFRPLDDEAETVTLTVTISRKDRPAISAARTFDLTVSTLDLSELDTEIALMEEVKAGFADALKAENPSIDAVTSNLASFQEVHRDPESGELVWVRSHSDRGESGIIADALDGWYDSQMWRVFRSSDAHVISHENMLVTRPAYNTNVTISSVLTSQRYGHYYERFKDDVSVDPAVLAKLATLYRQPVQGSFLVLGTTGYDDPAGQKDTIDISVAVIGASAKEADATFTTSTFVQPTRVSVDHGSNTTAWTAFKQVLDRAGYEYLEASGLDPYSITTPDGRVLSTIRVGAEQQSYWAFYINGSYADIGPRAYELKDGDRIELRYLDTTGTRLPEPEAVGTNPEAEHPVLKAGWIGHANAGKGAVATSGTLPTEPVAKPDWVFSVVTPEQKAAGLTPIVGEPLVIDGKVYLVSGTERIDFDSGRLIRDAMLTIIDPADGSTLRSIDLAGPLDTTARPAYSEGIVVIPLSGGRLQAISAQTLETIWVTPFLPELLSVSTVRIDNGRVYVAATHAPDSVTGRAEAGVFSSFDLETGDLIGSRIREDAGFYWAGSTVLGDYVLIADESGAVRAYTTDLAEEAASLKVSDEPIRSTLVAYDGHVYVVSRDGSLHKLELRHSRSRAARMELVQVGVIRNFAASSTSTPTITDGLLYVGGLAEDGTGSLTVVDLDSWTVKCSISGAGEVSNETQPSVQSAPLVWMIDGSTYVYFTSNQPGGSIFMYRLGDTSFTELFLPAEALQDYTLSSVITDGAGRLFYSNDSGAFFALSTRGVGAAQNPDVPATDEDTVVDSGEAPDTGENAEPIAPVEPSKPASPETPTTPSPDSNDPAASALDGEHSDGAGRSEGSEAMCDSVSAAGWNVVPRTADKGDGSSLLAGGGVLLAVCGAVLLVMRRRCPGYRGE